MSEVLKMDFGEKVPSVKGKISNIYDQTTGQNNYGDWAIQNIEICDPADPKAKIKVKLFDQQEVPKVWRNKLIYLECVEGDKGIKGIEIAKDTYKLKEGAPPRKMLEVRRDAQISLAEAEPPPASQAAAPAASQGEQPAGAAQAQPARPAGKTPDQAFAESQRHVADAMKFLNRRANSYELVMRAVDYLARRRSDQGKAITPDHYQAICASLYISLDRAGMVDPIPTGVLDKFLASPPAEEGSK